MDKLEAGVDVTIATVVIVVVCVNYFFIGFIQILFA